jgi:iron complex outermembrane receptor protein
MNQHTFHWLARLVAGGAVLTCGAAAAQQAASTSGALEEIVVTAQKREQALQDVSVAVTAMSADRLVANQVNNLQDMQTIVPSVNFGSDFNQAKLFIRGVGANTSTTGNSTSVALYVDGAVVARAEAQLTSLFDLQRVEVLRGPQGTLYGRNTTGGSVNLITAEPTRELSGYARVTGGNYSALSEEFAVSGPITSSVLFRIAGKNETRGGFGVNPVSGQDVDDVNRRMTRGNLQFDFTDNVRLRLTGEYFRQNDSSGAVHYLRDSFPGVARLASLGAGGYAVEPRDLATESQPGTDTKTYAFTGNLHIAATDALSFTNIANYRSFKSSLFQDLDLSAVLDSLQTTGQATTVQERRIDSEQYSDELQVNYANRFFNIVGGAFYFHERQRPRDNVGLARRNGMESNIAVLTAAGFDLATAYALCGYSPGTVTGGSTVIAPKRVCIHSDLGNEAYAVFGQANIGLGAMSDSLDSLSIKLGGRYSNERVDSANPAVIIARNGLGPVVSFTTAGTFRKRKFSDFTPEYGIEWRPTGNILAYYTYSEGFKAGSGENAAGSTTIVDPEEMKNHEVGIKTSLFDRRMIVNLAYFHYTLDGAQLNKTIPGGPSGFQTIFQNAARTSADGAELELAGVVGGSFRWSGALSYTDAKFDDYTTLDPLNFLNIITPGCTPWVVGTTPTPVNCISGTYPPGTVFPPGSGLIQLAGNQVRNTPKLAWNLHGEYDLPVQAALGGRLTLQADVSHKDRVYFSEYQRNLESSDPYTMVDAALLYTGSDDKVTVQLWGKNLTDEDQPSSTFALATGRLIGVTYLAPRTYGVTVGYRF